MVYGEIQYGSIIIINQKRDNLFDEDIIRFWGTIKVNCIFVRQLALDPVNKEFRVAFYPDNRVHWPRAD